MNSHSRPQCFQASLTVILLVVIIGASSYAQRPTGGPDRLNWDLSYSNWYLTDADVDQTDGSFSMTRQRVSAKWASIGVTYQRWDFNWSDVASLPFGDGVHDPWKSLESVSVSARVLRRLGLRWSYVVGLSAGYLYESDTSDSFGAAVFGGMGYGFDRKTILRFGAMVSYHPIRTVVWPMVGLDLRSESGFSATIGFPKTELAWRFTPKWEASLSALADRAVARLADDSAVEPNGYLESTNYMGAVGLTYRPVKGLALDLRWAQSLSRSVTFYDEDGHETRDFDVGRAPGVLLGVTYRF